MKSFSSLSSTTIMQTDGYHKLRLTDEPLVLDDEAIYEIEGMDVLKSKSIWMNSI